MKHPVAIVGSGGFGREVAQCLRDIDGDLAPDCFLTDDTELHGATVGDLPVRGGLDWLDGRPRIAVCIAIGSPAARARVARRVIDMGHDLPTIIHPSVIVGARVQLGPGTIICAGSILTTDIVIGSGVIVNLSCTIGHDVIFGDWITVSPGARISGNVRVGSGCDLGSASSYVQGISIGEWSIVGAGAVVAKDLPANVTAVGMPAKPIKTRPPGWHLT